MSDRDAAPARVNSQISAILRIAADLRDLPSEDFRARLKQELVSSAAGGRRPAAAARRKARPIPEGYHTATTCLVVRDGSRAIDFYKQGFGAAELTRHTDPSGHLVHAEVMIGDTRIALAEEDPVYNRSPQSLGGASAIVQLYVEDADAFTRQAVAAGAKVVIPVADQFYGDRAGRLADPFGHLWIVSTHIEDLSAKESKRRLDARVREQSAQPPPKKEEPMMGVKPIPEGFHSITPYLQVEGAAILIDFLEQAFGAEEMLRVRRDDGGIAHAQVRVEGSIVELADATAQYKPNPTALWLFVGDADAAYKRALEAGAASLHAPVDQPYGDREAGVKDPFGNHWYIATHRRDAEPLPSELRSVTPYLHPIGSARLIEFMKKAFDAEELARAEDPEGTIQHAKVRIGDSVIAMGEAHGPYQPMPPALHLYVDDTDRAYARAIKAGATSISRPADQPYGDRGAGVKDPFGNVWYIATHIKDVPVERLQKGDAEPPQHQRPGSIAPFMYIEDAARAFEFYRKVFGARELHREVEPGGKVGFIQMAIGQTRLALREATSSELAGVRFAASPKALGGKTPLPLYIYVAEVDSVFARAIAEGAKVVDPLENKPWGDRCGGVQDPYGHVWFIATPRVSGSS